MAIIAKEHKDKLQELKQMVGDWNNYFGDNIGRYHSLRSFLFKSNLSEGDKQKLDEMGKPPIQFNKCEAFVSRLIGEFSQQEPSIMASASPMSNTAPKLIEVLNGYFRNIVDKSKKDGTETEVYKSQMSGGFDVLEVYTEYETPYTFNQNVCWGRTFDPTLCGFDPLARLPHKGDGNYCFKKYPKKISELKIMYPGVDWDDMKFSNDTSWSYENKDERVIMLTDLYKKRFEKIKLVYLANQKVMLQDDYNKMIENWMSIEQAPEVRKKRTAKVPCICRYIFMECEVLDYEELDYAYLPLVFVDGNSALLRDVGYGANSLQKNTGDLKQFTRPYFYNAIDMQKLINVSGQTIANKIEMLVQSQFMISQESVPEDLIDGWINPQKASMLVYNAYDNTGQQLPPPMPVQNIPMPPEVSNAFMTADQNIQSILGAYDVALGMPQNNTSGKAIIAGSTNSNAAARPYIANYLVSFAQVAMIMLDLLPKYKNTPQTLPIITKEGKNEYIFINVDHPDGANFDYDPSSINVTVKPGVNFEIQKDKDLAMLMQLAQSSPVMNEFLNTEGLPFIFDNLNIKNADILKEKAQVFVQQKSEAAKSSSQNNPMMMEMQLKQQELQMGAQIKQQELQIKQQDLQMRASHKQQEMAIADEKMKISKFDSVLKFIESHQDNLIRMIEAQNTAKKNAIDVAMSKEDQAHRHAKETVETIAALVSQPMGNEDLGATI